MRKTRKSRLQVSNPTVGLASSGVLELRRMDDTSPRQSNKKPWPEIAMHASLRFLQFVLGATVTALYGKNMVSPNKPAQYDRTKWVWQQERTHSNPLGLEAC